MASMRRLNAILLAGAALLLAACGQQGSPSAHDVPATTEPIAGTELSRIFLSDHARQRLDIQTTDVRPVEGQLRLVIPDGALLYDPHGATWVYVETEPLVYVRHEVSVEHVDGGEAMLYDGPAVGARVVMVGSAELYGIETGIGGGH